MPIARAHFILYVADQVASTAFYQRVLELAATLDVPGMTELPLPGGAVLGLMPERGITRLLHVEPTGQSRAELYLLVDDPAAYFARALSAGARELSPLAARDWGHQAAYCADPDGYILAFASPCEQRYV
jgi:catechol 2,3-dioxygenase-like lactoylglutathione lyase family enzyme